jgi:hypothetical protein
MWRSVLLVIMLVSVSSCGGTAKRALLEGSNSKEVSREDYGEKWPLTVKSGVLACSGSAVTFKANGVIYALNGTALTQKKWVNIAQIQADDPSSPPGIKWKKSVDPLIKDGLKLCSE